MRCLNTIMMLCLSANFLMPRSWAVEPQLSFAPSVVEINPTIDETSSVFTVRATNVTNRTIDIKEFKGGCGCISFECAVQSLEPGDSTDVLVVFDFKDFTGPQKRTLSVITQSPSDSEVTKNSFSMKGEIPTALKFSKKAAIWLYGESPAAKELTVSVKDELTISDLTIEDLNINHFITVVQSPSQDGRSLLIRVTPTTTNIEEVSPVEKSNLQVPYVVKYKTNTGKERYERFWVLLAKKPEIKAAPGKSTAMTPEAP